MQSVGPGIWQKKKTHKQNNEKQTLQDLEYGKKTEKKENKKHTL
jgi:hypothetical protein